LRQKSKVLGFILHYQAYALLSYIMYQLSGCWLSLQ